MQHVVLYSMTSRVRPGFPLRDVLFLFLLSKRKLLSRTSNSAILSLFDVNILHRPVQLLSAAGLHAKPRKLSSTAEPPQTPAAAWSS